ncbi:MAG: phosphatase PAP2 family protein [Acidimicrobiia bacterium]|nr:phosphatase PAP2 family protein [Acidimicrobiia bacterium]
MSLTARSSSAQTEPESEDVLPAPVRRRQRGLRWWKEVLYVLAFYLVYSAVRNSQGSATVSAAHALHNAMDLIRIEKAVGIFHEQALQHAAISVGKFFIEFWNIFYGTFHFIVTAFVLIYIFRRFPERYARWRNTLACTTALALVGFALYPLMPPRLLDLHGLHYSFIDTLEKFETVWSFDSGTMQKISNQYAAMPSLHFAWSLWCALTMTPVLRRWWTKALAMLYPACTLFAIVVTANHYILDAAGGAVCLGIGYLIGGLFTRRWEKRPAAEAAAAA